MNKDKKILYSLSFLIFAVLLLPLMLGDGERKIVTACLLAVLALVTVLFIRKRASLSINKREVLLLSTVIAAIYVIAIQMLGIFFGFYRNPYFVNVETLLITVIPMIAMIITTEMIRSVLLAQKNGLVSLLAFLSVLLCEVLMFSDLTRIDSVNRFMDLVGLTLFPAISANVYYHYASRRFGALPNIAFRLITTMYLYCLPSVSAVSDAILACSKIFLPIGMLAFISAMYEKKPKKAIRRGRKLSVLGMILAIAIVTSVSMLISCQFRVGAMVIATGSMTGEINKGDMIIYERYEDQSIKEGQVIVFSNGQSKIVHRVVKIEHIGGEIRYYTKGDANPVLDDGYRVASDIVGLTDVKISYVGYPTLWLYEALKNKS